MKTRNFLCRTDRGFLNIVKWELNFYSISLSLSERHSPGVERGVIVAREHGFLGVGPDGEVHQRVPVIDLVAAQDIVLSPVRGLLVLSKHD